MNFPPKSENIDNVVMLSHYKQLTRAVFASLNSASNTCQHKHFSAKIMKRRITFLL